MALVKRIIGQVKIDSGRIAILDAKHLICESIFMDLDTKLKKTVNVDLLDCGVFPVFGFFDSKGWVRKIEIDFKKGRS
jgi:hypothetical protein